MTNEKIQFTKEKETMLMTLNGRAIQSQWPNPILPDPWAEEAMIMFMILGVFTGAIAVTWRNVHIRIDTFVERSSPNVERIIRVAATFASMFVLLVVALSWIAKSVG